MVAGEDDAMQRDHYYDSARALGDLAAAHAVGVETGRRTLARLDSRSLSTRNAPVILSAELARGFFGHLVGAVSGGSLYRKASFLLDAQGRQIFPGWMQIYEQPHLLRGPGSSNFDDEGVATLPNSLVSGGVLERYVLGSYSARKLGLSSTGNAGGVHNLTVTPNAGALAELLGDMGTGLYVTELLGQGVNLITGDYSRGAAGFWVEQGKIIHPVHEITIAGNLKQMFTDIIAVGNEIDHRGNVRTGPIHLREMTIAGESGQEED